MQPAEGSVIAGKYVLVAPIARGGMGMVWEARHTKLGTRLAVKFVDPTYVKDATFLARFEREARAAAVIESPHVVHVQDFGVEDGTPYLVMELLQGEDLGMRLRRQRRLSIGETARILVQSGHALRRAHEAGIIHRDLKPANLYLARVYDQEIVKVLDFGIAKETAGQIGETTTTGEVIGSPHYMGPEQARADKDIDSRSDLWSVGVLVYRMLTGGLPFPGDVMGAILAKVFVEPPPPVATAAPDLPAELDGFFARALAKNKLERFQTIDELVDAFLKIAEQHGELPADVPSLTVSGSGPRVAASVSPVAVRGSIADVATPPSAPSASLRPVASTPPTPRPDPATPASLPSGPAVVASAPPDPSTPAPGPASTTSPSIATSITSVHDMPVAAMTAPRRRATLIAGGAAALVIAGGALSLWLGGPPEPPGGAAGATPSDVAPTPSVTPVPSVTPAGPVSTAAPTVDPSAAASASPTAEPSATASASAGPEAPPAVASGAPSAQTGSAPAGGQRAGGSPGQRAAPATSGKRSTRGDEWGF